jgi:uncharacterized protein (DUF362 family)
MNRRTFLKVATVTSAVALAPRLIQSYIEDDVQKQISCVAFVKCSDRSAGIARAIDLLELPPWRSKDVFIKPNFNSADATPGSTHPDTLAALIEKLRKMDAGPLTIGDRSGMGNTHEVMETKEVFRLARDFKVNTIVFDDLPANDWVLVKQADTHWLRGFALPRPVLSAGAVVQTCCLKTHRFGGHFTLSLKNSVGLAAKRLPNDSYNFMSELHGSPHQRRMIAEINAAYKPNLIVLDGVEAFVTEGPERGKKVNAQILLAGTDRIAIDAVGVALLRYHGTTPEVQRGTIFEQEQIARAVELGIGISGPEQIELVTDDRESASYAAKIRAILTAPCEVAMARLDLSIPPSNFQNNDWKEL